MVDFPLLTISTKYGISANKDLRKKQPNNLNLQKILLLDILEKTFVRMLSAHH